jgi:predicted pyridoxine 5'-phosphate oxidase superfamily flavin-nucleotide-binding protein
MAEEPLVYNDTTKIEKVQKEVLMAKLTEEAKKAVGTIRPSLVATANKAGKPNVSAKGSLRVLDDEHLLFADVASPRTVANIRENPQVAVICLDAATRKGCRIWGKGEVFNSGELFDKTVAELASKKMKVRNVVKVTVEEVETF